MDRPTSSASVSKHGVAIAFADDGVRTPTVIEASASLATAILRAADVNRDKEAFAISFASLFIGLLATPDHTGEWLVRQFERTNADLYGLLRRRGLDHRSAFDALRDSGPTASPGVDLLKPPFSRTASARQALEAAQPTAPGAYGLTDTRHVLTALLSLPGFHDSDFRALRIERDVWLRDWNAERVEWPPGELPPQESPSVESAGQFDPRAPGLERHVATALMHANALAEGVPIGPEHVITAIVRLADSISSAAFRRFAQLVPLPAERTLASPGPLPTTDRFDADLLRVLARAQMPAAGGTAPSGVWGRDLVTAALLCSDEAVAPIVSAAGQPLDVVRDLWYAFLTADSKHRPAGTWASWWRDANVPLPGPRRAGYATETDQGDDKLGIEAEAHAFARLILDRDVAAPLSIGLLGDWGSGKSFFIEQIKKGIAHLRGENRPELYRRVVEIEFNAWHASDSNLWASLVTNIFDAIWENVTMADETMDAKTAQERLQKEIKEAHGAVHEAETQVELGRQALETAERDLEKTREKLALNRYVTSVTKTELQRLAKSAGWHESIDTINDVERTVASLAASGQRLRTLATTLLEKPLLRIALPTATLIALTAAVWIVVDLRASDGLTAQLAKGLATVASVVGALAVPLRIAKHRVDAFSNGLQGIHDEYEKNLADVKQANPPEAEAVARARRELESTEASVAAARVRLAELLNQQATLDPRRRLGAFLEERVRSTQYRSQQGIISLVHKDFSQLSKFMKELRDTPAAADSSDGGTRTIRPFDRVVIYVDDLDRCRPAHVVNMLEAVHLLLALDLFVVVVAVDSRWLMRALQVHYQELLTATDASEGDGLRSSTPQSYLEKIFQITYALGPMNPAYFRDYVAFLAGDEETKTTGTAVEQDAKKAAPVPDPSAADTRQPQASGSQRAASAAASQRRDETAVKTTPKLPRRSPAVHIGKVEREFITSLVPLLPTPRIAKRLVNVYRVIKATKSVQELEALERNGQFKACLLMLAILFGRPTLAGPLLRALHERRSPFDTPSESLAAALRRGIAIGDQPEGIRAEWQKLVVTLDAIGIDERVANCAKEAKEVARYSLVSGHDWHTWATPVVDADVPTGRSTVGV